MNRRSSIGIILFLLAALTAPASADVQLWTEAGLRYDISKQFRLKFDSHARFDRDLTATQSIMPEVAFSYRPFKFLRLEAGYRFCAEPFGSEEGTYFDSWHRLHADVRLRYRIKPVTVRYRLRYQEKFGRPWKGGEQLKNLHTVRNKVSVSVKLPAGFRPFVSGEIFNRVGDSRRAFHKWRLSAGLEYTLGSHQVALFYRREEALHDDPGFEPRNILAFGYHYGF
jgi:hypothetical protein